ncbi:hypothetical protein [Micromonospora rosaria]|uniref:hypothetical protein n=1 Tax=Micromonospora rosaria TaxID=47874 RepID=UPI0012F9E04E|nr:hypothetical protein [Micromonospora rosaria]
MQELMDAHAAVGGQGPGRRVGTAQLNWSMVLRLAGEFQGFARDLHDLGVDYLVQSIAPPGSPLASTLQVNLTLKRDLDRGNAQPGSLGNDFLRFGFQIWPALAQKNPRSAQWNKSLEALNKARNAIAHAEDHKLKVLAADGYPMHLRTIRTWRSHLNSLAGHMDMVVADSLAVLTGKGAPW